MLSRLWLWLVVYMLWSSFTLGVGYELVTLYFADMPRRRFLREANCSRSAG